MPGFRSAGKCQSNARRSDAASRAQILAAFQRSGLSAVAFTRQQGINCTTFCGWRARQARTPAFVEVQLDRSERATPAEFVIELGGQAIRYALEQWPLVTQFLEHGQVEVDNNLVENAIRPTAVGKKNWMFFGSEDAGQRNAVIFTLVENCRMHGIDPYDYLKDVLERLPTAKSREVETLTPLHWKKARAGQARPSA